MAYQADIDLPSGRVEIEYTDKLLDQIRVAYGLGLTDPVNESIIIVFLENELRTALKNNRAMEDRTDD